MHQRQRDHSNHHRGQQFYKSYRRGKPSFFVLESAVANLPLFRSEPGSDRGRYPSPQQQHCDPVETPRSRLWCSVKWGEAPVVSVEEAGVSCAQCAHCPKATHAMQGSRCSQCQDGNQPGGDNLSCRACPTGHAGTRGTCAKCTGKWVPNPQRTACDKKRPVWKEDWFVYLIAASLAVAAIAYVFRKMCRRIANKQSPEPESVIPASSGKGDGGTRDEE